VVPAWNGLVKPLCYLRRNIGALPTRTGTRALRLNLRIKGPLWIKRLLRFQNAR
jgi:hypothetical protein